MKSGGRANKRDESDVLKGLAAGLIGGLVASWTMNQFQALLSKLSEEDKKSQSGKSAQQGGSQQEQKRRGLNGLTGKGQTSPGRA